MKFTRLLAVLLLVTSTTAPAVATPNGASNEAPLPDAGLDQSVTRGSTVHLDAGGSRDPDGTITDYEWTVDAPNGTTTTLDCSDCERATFQATTIGEYAVTLAATDDDGATATDTLYVDVEPGAPPTVSLAGPSGLLLGERGDYTATVSAGAAPLDHLVWYADGERYATTNLDGTAASTDRQFQFPDAGTHELRVVAVDEDEQRANATRAIDVNTAGGVDPTDPSDETDTESPAPDVQGPRVVTGDTVLDATYGLTNDTITADWFLDDRHVDVGNTATLTLSAGTHELYASPDSGGLSTFPDGSRDVLADPAPAVHIERATEESILTVDAYATDELGNLQSLEVLVDGEVRETSSLGGIERRATGGDRLADVYRLTDVSPGERNVTVRATDSRGQTAAESRTVRVPGPPEVKNAQFVNDEPLSSKHPKLDPEDYTAQFEIAVDLNGVNPEYVKAKFRRSNGEFVSKTSSPNRSETPGYGLTIQQNFSRIYDGNITADGLVYWDRGNSNYAIESVSGKTYTELSEPIIRLNLTHAQNYLGSRGATFDASGSFDPEGTELEYYWNDVNSSADWFGPVNQLHPRKLIYLNVTDQQDQYNRTFRILDWFTPGLQTPEVRDVEPVFPQERVTYRVRTNQYELSKVAYEKEEWDKPIDFELVSEEGTVWDHRRYAKDENGGQFDQNLPEDFNEAFIFHQWDVTVPVSEFLESDNPTVRIQSTRQSESFREVELPAPKMYDQIRTSTSLTDFDVTYVEKRPSYEVRTTAREEYKKALQEMGFDLYSAQQTGAEYHLEKRVKTEPAQWNTITRDFDRKFQRQLFLEGKTDWRDSGSSEQRRQRTVVDRVWRDSRGGSGEFTGNTRSVQVEPAEVETLREYEYTKSYDVEVSVEEERKRCLPMMGCQTYTVETTETRTRFTTVSYWSSRPRNPRHRRTGDTRTRTVERAEYERQYQFRVESTETYWENVYHASTQKKVKPAQYEWQSHKVVKSDRIAAITTMNPDVRRSHTELTREWTLHRQDGTLERTNSTPEKKSRVVETRMTATATVEAEFLPPDAGVRSEIVTKERTVDVRHNVSQFIPIEESKNIIRDKANRTHADDY